jgi:predicted regulator of Ras-like GTPase activity (Roadblock/LC7/MglB family)
LRVSSKEMAAMPVSGKQELRAILNELRDTKGVVASTVISRDGVPVVTDLPPQVNPDILALRTAFMQGIGELVMESVEDETARTVIIVAEQHYILTSAIDDRNILVVVLDRKVEVGGMIPGVLDTTDSLRKVLEGI